MVVVMVVEVVGLTHIVMVAVLIKAVLVVAPVVI
jgi:hypothetical protein